MTQRNALRLPEHRDPGPLCTASAPYSFVPLPEKVVTAVADAEKLPDHSTFAYGDYTRSGYLDVTLTTLSPLYIRAPLTQAEFQRQEDGEPEHTPYADKVKNKPVFFYTSDQNNPVIPGSSLRGMLRALVDIVSYGKVSWVTDKKLFLRTVDDTAVGMEYNRRMVEPMGHVHPPSGTSAPGFRSRVRGGFFRIRRDGTFAIEECVVARVETRDVLAAFGLAHRREIYELGGRSLTTSNDRNPNQTPSWSYQHCDIWADVAPADTDNFFPAQRRPTGRLRHPDLYLRFRWVTNLATKPASGKTKGKLVLTGHMEFKHLAFMFVPVAKPKILDVPNDPSENDPNKRLVERFHDDDQMTRWQTQAFPDGCPTGAQRQRNGYLRDGEPVFFLADKGGNGDSVVFFGRAQMFRLPYTQRPLDLVPPELRRPEDIDYADALFGFVRTGDEIKDTVRRGLPEPKQGTKGRAYAGRVFVTDATLAAGPKDIWLSKQPITPRILASPKPTAFQHYLVQGSDDRRQLKHYDSKPLEETVIRGHKLYWHQGDRKEADIKEADPNWLKPNGEVKDNSTQHTRFRPLDKGVHFTFRVYFENLSERELGALCWALHPLGDQAKEYRHSLGMGKPLGMGAVKLEASLHLIDRPQRYAKLFNDKGDWETGDNEKGVAKNLKDRSTLEGLTSAFEKQILDKLNPQPPCDRLCGLKRIAMLLKLMEWPGCPPEPEQGLFLSDQQRPNTRYMVLGSGNNEYRNRPVLPTPAAFGKLTGDAEPGSGGAVPAPVGATTPIAFPSHQEASRQPAKLSGQRTERVTLLEEVKNGKARVRTRDGQDVVCSRFPPYGAPGRDEECRAELTYRDGKLMKASFKRRLR